MSHNTSRTCELAKRYNPDLLAVSFLMPDLPGDFNTRRYIRETWVADAMQLDRRSNFCDSLYAQPVPDDRAVCIDIRFVIGVGRGLKGYNEQLVDYDAVAAEARQYQDIVILPVLELGSNLLVLKMMATFNWALRNRAYADYVVKIDTDAYVYPPRFVQHLPVPSDELILVGRQHPDTGVSKRWRDTNPRNWCNGGELYGFSRELFKLLGSPAPDLGTSESDVLNAFLMPDHGSHWANNDSAWTHEFEDLSACALIDRTMARNPDKHLTSRLRAPPDFTGLWVHKIKDEAMFRRCHDPGQWCEGEESVVLATPAQFDDSRCYA